MPISITLPEGNGFKTGTGTKVHTEGGTEITGISRMTIEVGMDSLITATIEVCVSEIKNADGIFALLPPEEVERVIEWAKSGAGQDSNLLPPGLNGKPSPQERRT